MSEDTKVTEQTQETTEVQEAQEAKPEEKQAKYKYTDEDVDQIVQEKKAKWQKQQEDRIAKLEEAAKLEKMNETEKDKYTIEKLEKEIADYKRKENLSAMAKVAKNMLLDEGIKAKDSIIEKLISEDAEGTKQRVGDFAELFKSAVEDGVQEALKGKSFSVKATSTKNNSVTKKEILGVKDPVRRRELIEANQELFL